VQNSATPWWYFPRCCSGGHRICVIPRRSCSNGRVIHVSERRLEELSLEKECVFNKKESQKRPLGGLRIERCSPPACTAIALCYDSQQCRPDAPTMDGSHHSKRTTVLPEIKTACAPVSCRIQGPDQHKRAICWSTQRAAWPMNSRRACQLGSEVPESVSVSPSLTQRQGTYLQHIA
jgi:hypothetical protein